MSDQEGPFVATGGADNAAIGTLPWGSTGYITTEDGNLAYSGPASPPAKITHYLEASFAAGTFTIPEDSVIDGIIVDIKRNVGVYPSGSANDYVVRLYSVSAGASDNKASATDWPTVLTFETYGAAADDWGYAGALTPAMINDGELVVQLSVTLTPDEFSSVAALVDVIRVTAYYTETVSSSSQSQLSSVSFSSSASSESSLSSASSPSSPSPSSTSVSSSSLSSSTASSESSSTPSSPSSGSISSTSSQSSTSLSTSSPSSISASSSSSWSSSFSCSLSSPSSTPSSAQSQSSQSTSSSSGSQAEWQKCCDCCIYFADPFDREDSTDVGDPWFSQSGSWRIEDNYLVTNDANAVIVCKAEHPSYPGLAGHPGYSWE